METPPQAWGRRKRAIERALGDRNTPTGVGKTGQTAAWRRPGQKHPHRRGEDPLFGEAVELARETPPQAWGRLSRTVMKKSKIRNTPTGVGKTSGPPSPGGWAWKHPHRRGEDHRHPGRRPGGVETPPQAWGRPPGTLYFAPSSRNTPTGVGKTPSLTLHSGPPEKHPHRRGEDTSMVLVAAGEDTTYCAHRFPSIAMT